MLQELVSLSLVLLFVNSCKSLELTFFNSVGFLGSLHSQAVLLWHQGTAAFLQSDLPPYQIHFHYKKSCLHSPNWWVI